ncbi:MAG: hypothetical protein K2X29_02660, partial [Candidatus Obscuribacterales bacterium]|nr:hypothetical protein [Candidatus Obscuribacterales bacterium]
MTKTSDQHVQSLEKHLKNFPKYKFTVWAKREGFYEEATVTFRRAVEASRKGIDPEREFIHVYLKHSPIDTIGSSYDKNCCPDSCPGTVVDAFKMLKEFLGDADVELDTLTARASKENSWLADWQTMDELEEDDELFKLTVVALKEQFD